MVEKRKKRKRKPKEGTRVKKHGRKIKGTHFNIRVCPICGGTHTKNEHRFHGVGSFDRTHGSGVKKRRSR